MREPSELAWRLQVVACYTVVFLDSIYIGGISATLSRRIQTKPADLTAHYYFAVKFDILRLFHVLLVVVAIIGLSVIAPFTTWDPDGLILAIGVYGAFLWVSYGSCDVYLI
jgi:hypothetical protein